MDPISNMIIMLKNASLSNKKSVSFPYSNMKNAVAECLKKEGYINQISKKTRKNFPMLEIELTHMDKKPKITGVERISKQSRRVYFKMKDIHSVRNGSGLLVLSTQKEFYRGKKRKEQVGGEAL